MSKWLMKHEDHLDSRFHLTFRHEDGTEDWIETRPIFAWHGLVVHRSGGDSGEYYRISHLHTGKVVMPPFKNLRTAFDFMRALVRVFDFDNYRSVDGP